MIGFNGSNYTNDWMSLWLNPYIHVFGDMFFALFLLIIAGGIYVGTDRNTFIPAIYCFVCAAIFGPILNFFISAFVLLIAGLVFSMITYDAMVEKRMR